MRHARYFDEMPATSVDLVCLQFIRLMTRIWIVPAEMWGRILTGKWRSAPLANDVVWVGTPKDVIGRIEAVQELCTGLTEVAITVNPGGVEHWKTIKTQELFARHVMPHFASAGAP
jgi:hypothetical protein